MTLSVGIELATDAVRAVPFAGSAGGPAQARLAVPPAILIRPSGELVVGAVERWPAGSGELYRDFGDRVGDPVPVIGSEGCARLGADLVALTVSGLLWQVTRGRPADHLTIAHPSSWGRYHTSVLRSALTTTWADSSPTTLVSGAVAAATSAQRANAIRPGETVLVADIGGDQTELTLVWGGGDGRPRQIISTATLDEVGARLWDRALAAHIVAQLPEPPRAADPAGRAALRELVARARIARTELINQPATVVPVRLPSGTERVRVVRGEFDSLIEESISCAASAVFRTLREARGNGIEVAAVLLSGEPARTPLLAEQLSDHVTVFPPDPEWTIARGAAEIAASRAAAASRSSVPVAAAQGVRVTSTLSRAPAEAAATPRRPAPASMPGGASVSAASASQVAPALSIGALTAVGSAASPRAERGASARSPLRSVPALEGRHGPRPPAADVGRSRSRLRDAAISAAAGVALLAAGGVVASQPPGTQGTHHSDAPSYNHGSPPE